METSRFSFVIHPLTIHDIHAHPLYGWTRHLPDKLVEYTAAYMPPLFVSKIKGIVSPTTGRKAEGLLYALSATPQQMLAHKPEFTYRRVLKTAQMAEHQGAKIIGLGAFTSVVGDAGITIANHSPIAVTSGNSLTAALAIESARRAADKMQVDFRDSIFMVVGATGSIGSAVAKTLAKEIKSLYLVSRSKHKLKGLSDLLKSQYPNLRVGYATHTRSFLPFCDIIITATSAFAERIIDVSVCKPGAIICDVARPFDINQEEAALRPDILVVDSGEVKLPGEVNVGYNIGLEPGVVFACMAETALLTLEQRFENFTLGRHFHSNKVREMLKLFKKHGFELAPMRSLGRPVSDEEIAHKRQLVELLNRDELKKRRLLKRAAEEIATIQPMAKGIKKAS